MFSKLLEALEWDKLHRLLHPDIFAWFMILGENIFFSHSQVEKSLQMYGEYVSEILWKLKWTKDKYISF